MEAIKIIFLIAILMALSITLTLNISKVEEEEEEEEYTPENKSSWEASYYRMPSSSSSKVTSRGSRFLTEETNNKNPKAADHCHKDNDICNLSGQNATVCCTNKCVNLKYNSNNCGACKKKCKYTEVCCRGECVDLAFDKRHCGKCNNRCPKGEYCIYGMCDYA